MTRRFYIVLGLLMTVIVSCNLLDDDALESAYIVIDKVDLETTSSQGSNTHKITSVRAFMNNVELGVFQIPAKIPVLIPDESILQEIRITAGISPNGSSDKSFEYPFYKPYISQIEIVRGIEYKIPVVFSYISAVKFDFIEDFTSGNYLDKDLDGDSQTKLLRVLKQNVSDGLVGEIVLTSDHPDIDVTSTLLFNNAGNQQGAVFLEFDYRCNIDLFCGAYIQTNTSFIKQYKVGLRPTNDWNKTYIDLTDEISNSSVINYAALFGAVFDESFEVDRGEIYIDNIKLLHF